LEKSATVKRRGTDLGQQLQPVLADLRILGVDRHLVEEGIDRRAQFGQRPHGAGEILDVDGRNRILLQFLDLGGECRSLPCPQQTDSS
jgi:hypothetical protein